MFGLTSPLRDIHVTSEFDNVNKIFSQSSFQEPVYQTSPYLAKADENGEIFEVEVDQIVRDTDSDGWSVSSRFPCSTSDDTGYSSDTDVQATPSSRKTSKKIGRISRLWKKKEIKLFSEAAESCDSWEGCDCRECSQVAMTNVKNVLLLVDPDSRGCKNGSNSTSRCELVLGIVPGYHGLQLLGNGGHELVYVRDLLPGGPAAKVKDIKIGDCLKTINGQKVTRSNLDNLLASIVSPCKVKLGLQSSYIQSLYRPKHSSTEQLVSMVTGEEEEEEEDASVVLYMSLDEVGGGAEKKEKEEKDNLVYHYPDNQGLLLAMRGMFYTLCHTVKDFTSGFLQQTTITVNGEIFNLCFHIEGKDLLIFAVSNKRLSRFLLEELQTQTVRLIQVLFGSVEAAFKSRKNHRQLDHILGVVLRCGVDSDDPTSINRLLYHTNYVQYLSLPPDTLMAVNNILSEFEAGDFVDMSDSYYGLRRSYSILGSCLFYKDYLVCSHLNKEHLLDIHLYLQLHGLLPLTTRCPVNQLVIWREVQPTLFCSDVAGINNVFGYSEPDARWFLLVVGLKSSILAVLLEAGGCSVRREGVTLPDPFYIDQAKSTLVQTLTANITNSIESRCQGHGLPVVTSIDSLQSKGQSSLDISFPLFKSGNKRDEDNEPMSRHRVTSPRKETLRRKASIDSDASSSSNDSLLKCSKTSRLFGDLGIPVVGSRWIDDMSYKISQGEDNCVLSFCYMDGLEGIYISHVDKPTDSVNQSDLLYNFHRCCSQIRQMFNDAKKLKKLLTGNKELLFYPEENLVDVKEHGVLFTIPSSSLTPEGKKPKSCLSYWVVGRKLTRGTKKEIYICFLDSTPQNLIEAAFQLGFSKTGF